MPETPEDDDPLVGEDYQAELRRIAQSSIKPKMGNPKGSKYKKSKPDDGGDNNLEDEEEEAEIIGGTLVARGNSQNGYDFSVTTPSGATLPVLTAGEVDYYEDRASRYMEDHRFGTVTDLQDLDRVLSTELTLHRYDVWLTLGADYWGQAVAERDLLRYNKELSKTLQDLKKSMGLDKATRDKDQGADFVAWLDNVRYRAKQFGIMRNEQSETSIVLFHELIGKLQLYFNVDDIEAKELGMSAEEVIQWIWDDLIPRFKIIDEHFRREGPDAQRYWIQEL